MKNSEPKRLTNDRYLGASLPIQIYSQSIHRYFQLHWHEFYELCFIWKGKGTNIVNGTSYPLQEGSLFLLTPADFHEVFPNQDDPIELYNIVFTEEMLTDEMRGLLFHNEEMLMLDLNPESQSIVLKLFQTIDTELAIQHTGFRIVVKGLLERIFVELIRSRPGDSDAAKISNQRTLPIGRALLYLQHHFREDITLEQVARHAQLAPNYFSERFKKETGVTFQKYLQELRIGFARSLLRASTLPITEICFASGFQTLNHFERVFKLKYGLSPRKFRSGSPSK